MSHATLSEKPRLNTLVRLSQKKVYPGSVYLAIDKGKIKLAYVSRARTPMFNFDRYQDYQLAVVTARTKEN